MTPRKMPQNAYQVLNGRLQKFDILGRYRFVTRANPTNENQTEITTRNLHTEYILNHTGELEIWKSADEKTVIVHTWTQGEYESENVYVMDKLTKEAEDWRVYALPFVNLVIIRWTSCIGEIQTAYYEFHKEKLVIRLNEMGNSLSRIVMYKKLGYKPEYGATQNEAMTEIDVKQKVKSSPKI